MIDGSLGNTSKSRPCLGFLRYALPTLLSGYMHFKSASRREKPKAGLVVENEKYGYMSEIPDKHAFSYLKKRGLTTYLACFC